MCWMFILYVFVFFFKQKTAYEMRISYWSSDVCSTDLILDPKDEGLVPHLDGQHQHLIECEENRNLKEHGQTASQRIDLFLAIKLHHFLLKAGLVVLEFFLKCLHFRLYGAHCGHGGELLLDRKSTRLNSSN